MRRFVHYLTEERGASAAEFALVLIPFTVLVFSIIGLSMLLYANQTLQFATQSASRYYSVQCANGSNPTVGQVQNFGKQVYKGPSIAPTFTPVTGGCTSNNHEVTGQVKIPLNAGLIRTTIQLKAHANFP